MKSVINRLENETAKQKIIRMIEEIPHLYKVLTNEEKIQSLTGYLYNNYLMMGAYKTINARDCCVQLVW